MKCNYFRRETRIAKFSLFVTVVLYYLLADTLAHKVYDSYFFPNSGPFYGGLVYLGALSIVFYSVVHYHVCLIGNYKRQRREKVPTLQEIATLYDNPAPSVTVLIPSFKEERQIMLHTMLSAALSEYPYKNVVLLIDNPQKQKDEEEASLLSQARSLPQELQQQFNQQLAIFSDARNSFIDRQNSGNVDFVQEAKNLSSLYNKVADWFELEAKKITEEQPPEEMAGDTRFFIDKMLLEPAALHRQQATEFFDNTTLTEAEAARHYNRLVSFFNVNFSSFERKRYINLSHDANKAMNLNSYIMLIGRKWKEVETPMGIQLIECSPEEEGITIPDADYVNTIDADSLMTHDYILRLVYFLNLPENSKIAVAQSPCSATPGHRSRLEKIASASIDVQFHTHQGYTYWGASFWVGANAMLRKTALEAIKEVQSTESKLVVVYIQDRTLIEDTESSIDLVLKGWKLYNYPKRMTYSASPADFGSLLIQRRRWANGGLIILPKLIRYVFGAPKDLKLAGEFLMRFNYLAMTSLSVAMLLVYSFYTFSPRLSTPLLIYANLPYLFLFARDLKICGYRYTDALRVCAFNQMLLPVIAAGVFKQVEQMITGRKIPFGRTPKVKDRTGAPAFYYMLEVGLILHFLNRTIEEIIDQHWGQVIFAATNFAFLLYALIYFIGLRAMIEDMAVSLENQISRLKNKFKSSKKA
jgi:cellulose synthase/poly-beta-1,6-N-acetylglucosamine synthase-like glycosyltransferase